MAAFIGLLVLQAVVYYTSGIVDCGVVPQTHAVVALPVCTRNCSSEESNDETSYTSRKCSCSESCAVFGDCCHDSPHKNAASWQRLDFVCVSVAGVGRYRAASSCPDDQPSDLCEANLGYLPPVTSGATGTTYGNYYCAWCNGDSEHLVTWEVDLDCLPSSERAEENSSPFYIAYNQDEFSRINLQDKTESLCQFHVRGGNTSFLENLELRPCNSSAMISECSTSWKDISVVEKCRSYENPVYHHEAAYSNPHCAECNFVHLSHVQCESHLSEAKKASLQTSRNSRTKKSDRNLSKPGRPYSLSQLFIINATDCTPPEGSVCCAGERYEDRTKNCRKIQQGYLSETNKASPQPQTDRNSRTEKSDRKFSRPERRPYSLSQLFIINATDLLASWR